MRATPSILVVLAVAAFAITWPSFLAAQARGGHRPPADSSSVGAQALPCPDCGGGDVTPPLIWLNSPVGEFTTQYPFIEVQWCDGVSLNATSRWIRVNGVVMTSSFNYVTPVDPDCVAGKVSQSSTVALNVGANTIAAYICDNAGNCTTQSFTVNRVTPGAPAVATRNFNGDNQDRSLCLTVGAGQAAGIACGDLFVTHAMPAYRTMGRDRALTLFYSSHEAAPRPVIAAAVTQSSSTQTPNSVYAELRINGAVRASATYWTWYGGATRQIVLAYDASGDPSGLYGYTLLVRNQYTGSTYDATVSGTLIVVNRSGSEFGAGWWVAGLEQLVLGQSGGAILWLGGDGSAAVYNPVTTNVWARAAGAYRDTLVYANSVYTRTLRHGIQVKFDATGRHIQTVNRAGNTTTFEWGPPPGFSFVRLRAISVPPGDVFTTYTLGYDFTGNLYSITDPAQRGLNATVTGGNLVQLRDPDAYAVSFEYDAVRRLSRRVGRRGYGTVYTYGNNLRVTRVALPLTTNPADSAVSTVSHWDELGLALGVTSGTLSAGDTLWSYTRVNGPRTDALDEATFWVDRWGAPVRVRDPLGNITQVTRGDAASPALVTRVQTPDGRILGTGYNARGNLAWVADSTFEGTRTGTLTATMSYVYGNASFPDSPTEVRTPVDTTRYGYNPVLGLPDSVIAQGGARTVFGYVTSGPLQGLLLSVTPRGVRVVDTSAWTRSTQDLTTSFAYDVLGNDTATTLPSGSRTRRERDGYTRVFRAYDEANHRAEYSYDLLNRIITQTAYDPVSNPSAPWFTSRFVYSPTGQIDSILDPRQVTRSWGYDAADRAVMMTDEAGLPELRYYNRGGLTDSVRTRSGGVMSFRYDAAGQQLVTKYPSVTNTFTIQGHNATIPGDSIVRAYDAVGRVLSVRRSDDTITNTWNREGSLRSQRQLVRNGGAVMSNFVAEYWTDLGGRRTKHFNGTDTLRYAYGPDAQLATLAVQWANGLAPDTFRFFWDVLGRRDSVVYVAPGAHVSNGYDRDGRLRMVCSRHPSNPYTSDYLEHNLRITTMTVDGLSQSWTQSAGGVNGSGTSCSGSLPNIVDQAYLWQYDERHQLRRDASHDINYDGSGNRVARHWRPSGTLRDSLIYNLYRNRLAQRRGDGNGGTGLERTYFYDANGTLREEQRPSGVLDDTRLYYYNALGEMTGYKTYKWTGSAFQWLGSPTMCHYDAVGRRVLACNEGGAWFGFDGDNVIRNQGASTIWRYVHGPGTDDPLVGMYLVSPGQYQKYYYLTDGTGRQLAFTDASGNTGDLINLTYSQNGGNQAGGITASRTFENARAESPSAPLLSFYRNRYYDQNTGRWTQEDPIGVAGGVNLYQYVGNNPVMYTDPYGLKPNAEEDGADDDSSAAVQCPGGLAGVACQALKSVGRRLVKGAVSSNILDAAEAGEGAGTLFNPRVMGEVQRPKGIPFPETVRPDNTRVTPSPMCSGDVPAPGCPRPLSGFGPEPYPQIRARP